MNHPAFVVPGAMQALQAVGNVIQHSGIPPMTLELINLRASQINGCGVCAVQDPQIARKLGETDERLFAVAAWREARTSRLLSAPPWRSPRPRRG
jgi:AhpD family alkylhydroperoxidase